jgi:hypothetical protein
LLILVVVAEVLQLVPDVGADDPVVVFSVPLGGFHLAQKSTVLENLALAVQVEADQLACLGREQKLGGVE